MTTGRKIAYLAAPFGAHTPEEREVNTFRVADVSRMAVKCGYAPVFVHASIQAGGYGNELSPLERAAGLECACTIAAGVARNGGELWIITRDDGTVTPGCKAEREAFEAALQPFNGIVRLGTRNDWVRRLSRLQRMQEAPARRAYQ